METTAVQAMNQARQAKMKEYGTSYIISHENQNSLNSLSVSNL